MATKPTPKKRTTRKTGKLLAIIVIAVAGLWLLQSSRAHHAPDSEIRAADMNGDGSVNVFDLSYMLARWNTADQTADINGNGSVGIFDLSRMLSVWQHTVSGGGPPGTYQDNLARIQASTVRNTREDASPFLNTPSDQLYNQSSLYGPFGDYQRLQGSYNGNVFFENEYFPGNGAGTFRTSCEVSHFAYDDPIVFPNQPEVAHLHMFIGNTHTNAYSTYDTLLNSGGSTCNGGELNRTGYWVPAMFNGQGEVVVPSKAKFYYKTEFPAGIGKIQTYPDNLQLLGDKTNNVQYDLGLSTFRCNDIWNGAKGNPSATIPSCPSAPSGQPGVVEYQIFFDYCWNGNTATAGDWQANRDTNFAPPLRFWHSSECPISHPVVLPHLVTHIFYDIKPGENTNDWYMASDVDSDNGSIAQGGSTGHADWFGGWNKEVNREWVDNCSNIQGVECGAGLLADPARVSNPRALRLRNDWITGWGSQSARIPVADIYEQMCSASTERPHNSANGGSAAAYCRPHGGVSHE